MTGQSILVATGEGFRLIRQRPISVLCWAVVYMVLALGPFVGIAISVGPAFVALVNQMKTNPDAMSPELMLPIMVRMMALLPLVMLGMLAAAGIIYTAIYRAVLFPEKKAYAYMRLGWAELRTILIFFILYVLFMVAFFAAIMVLVIPTGIVAAMGNRSPGTALALGAMLPLGELAILLLLAWPFARLAMSLPMSLAENRFRLFEAWTLTRGYGWRIFGLVLVLFLIIFAMDLVLYGVVAAAVVGIGQEGLKQAIQNPATLKPYLIGVTGLYVVFVGIALPVMTAPWARVYQIIIGKTEGEPAGVFD